MGKATEEIYVLLRQLVALTSCLSNNIPQLNKANDNEGTVLLLCYASLHVLCESSLQYMCYKSESSLQYIVHVILHYSMCYASLFYNTCVTLCYSEYKISIIN